MAGLSPETTGPAQRISEIASEAAANPQIKALLEKSDNVSINDITDVDLAFASILNEYLDDYGCRIFHRMINYPTLREKPSILLGLIRNQLIKGFQESSIPWEQDKNRTEWLKKTRAKLEHRPKEDQVSFEKIWENAIQIYPIKEGCEYNTSDAPLALMRYALLEIGSRMTTRHHLVKNDDVFFLELGEAVQAIQDNKDLKGIVIQRKAEREWAATHPGPPFYGAPQHISIESFPHEIQPLAKGNMWMSAMNFGFGVPDAEIPYSKSMITGTAASSGRYTGPARIILDESDFNKIRVGDVLICPITTTSWSILFPSIGAIVTEAGGILSHPAIIAREYGLPAVVATRDATQRLCDGQMVTVDGSAGIIEIH
jgi:pyruvate,water dikinase